MLLAFASERKGKRIECLDYKGILEINNNKWDELMNQLDSD